jgi:cytochrome b561
MSIADSATSPPRSYTLGQIILHWSISALVVWQLVFGEETEALEHAGDADAIELFLANSHLWVGFAILALVALRIVLRVVQGVPPPFATGRGAAVLARISHAAFYVLLVAVPVTGILDYYFHLPTGEIHELGKPLFILLITLHVAATLWRQFIRHDGTLRRMLVPAR